MTFEVKDNNELVRWIGRWTANIKQPKDEIKHLPPVKATSTNQRWRPDPEGEGTKC
jgi:hypothetical protein